MTLRGLLQTLIMYDLPQADIGDVHQSDSSKHPLVPGQGKYGPLEHKLKALPLLDHRTPSRCTQCSAHHKPRNRCGDIALALERVEMAPALFGKVEHRVQRTLVAGTALALHFDTQLMRVSRGIPPC